MAIYDQIAQAGNRLAPATSFTQGQLAGQQMQQNKLALQSQKTANRQAIRQEIAKGMQWADTPKKFNQVIDYFAAQGVPGAEQYRDKFEMRDNIIAMATPQSKGMPFYAVPTSSGYAMIDKRTGDTRMMRTPSGDAMPPTTTQTGMPAQYPPLLPVSADPTVQAAVTGAKEKAKVIGKKSGEKITTKPKIEASIEAQTAKTGMLDDLITQAKDQSGTWTTGFIGKALSEIGGTSAHDLQNTLSGIRSNIGFDKLQQMRDQSPTGGALGQVSERENTLLQQVWGSMEQSQSQEQFEQNLERVRKQVKESWQRVMQAYKKDYGTDYPVEHLPWKTETPATGGIKFLGFE